MTHTTTSFHPLTVSKASAGSGKTFTLAAYYVALLMSGESFRHILAVTFTNKATEEMKSRILSYLYAISIGQSDSGTLSFIEKVQGIMKHLDAPEPTSAEMQELAGKLYRAILAEYDEMRVLTIDSFLQTLYAGMAQAIGMPTGMAVELDTEHVITTAVDQLLSDKMLNHSGLQSLIGEYIQYRLDEENKSDIRKSLISIAKEIYKESVQAQDYKIVYETSKLEDFRRLVGDWKADPACVEALKHIAVLEGNGGTNGKFTKEASQLTSYYKNYVKSFDGTASKPFNDSYDIAGFIGSESDMCFNGKLNAADQTLYYNEICHLVRLFPMCRRAYLYSQLTTAFLRDVKILSYIRAQIDENLAEENSKLLATAASELTKMLSGSIGADGNDDSSYHGVYDGSFILEKAGIRYHHIMLDEFQDTSNLQWINFLNLILEVLSNGEEGRVPHTCFIVGDIKQAIYRFRNGDWHIMDGLDENHKQLGCYFDADAEQLSKSYRSRYEVVRFNVSLFGQIAADEDRRINEADWHKSGAAVSKIKFPRIYNEEWSEAEKHKYYLTEAEDEASARRYGLYKPGKEYGHEGGFVRCRFYPMLKTSKNHAPFEKQLEPAVLTDRILADMFVEIDKMLQRNPDYARDILILVRKNAEESLIVDKFREMQKAYPALAATDLMTESSYLLEASRSVQTLIAALRYLVRADGVGGKYVRTVMGERAEEVWPLVEALDRRMPLTDMVEELVRLCLCGADGRFMAGDVAYVNCFTDRLRDFVTRYGSDPEAFLLHWEDKLHSEAVSIADTGLIRIMTVHKSKGLEAKTLFVPFCHWSLEDTPGNKKAFMWCTVNELTDKDGKPAILPIADDPAAFDGGFAQEYRDEHENRRLDNINLLYVGLTRAADNLFVYGQQIPSAVWSTKDQCIQTDEETDLTQLTADNVAALMLNAHRLAEAFNAKFVDYLTECKSEETASDEDAEAVEPEESADAEETVDEATLLKAQNCYVEILRGRGPLVPPRKKAVQPMPDEKAVNAPVAEADPTADELPLDPKPFSFKDRPTIPVELCRTNDNIEFRQSQQSQLYARYPEDIGRRLEESIRFGNICHDIMSHVEVHNEERDDVARVIDDFCASGIIESEEMLEAVHRRISDMWEEPKMLKWFDGSWRLLLEEPLLAYDSNYHQDGKEGYAPENRMDRVMIDDASSTAIVLDYKFGSDLSDKAMKHYEEQVRGYMNLLSRMGYEHVSGYLWLANDAEHLVEVNRNS